MENGTVKALPGTEGSKFPFWSPDGKSIGFFADQQLKRLDIAGGPPYKLGAGNGCERRDMGRRYDSFRSLYL